MASIWGRARGKGRAFKGDFESDSKKIKEITQEGLGSDKTRIENQVRLKAQL